MLALGMPIFNTLNDLTAQLSPGDRLAGLDVGDRTVGVALSDGLRRIASPIALVERRKFTPTAKALLTLFTERDVVGLIVGMPLEMDGTPGRRAQATQDFVSELLLREDRPTAFWDERLSTVAVERTMVEEFDLSRSKRAQKVDAAAATWILQGALDRLDRMAREGSDA